MSYKKGTMMFCNSHDVGDLRGKGESERADPAKGIPDHKGTFLGVVL